MQELKDAIEVVVCSRRHIGRFKLFMLEQGFGQLRELTESVAAAHAKLTTEVAMKICSRTGSATQAFTTLRARADAHTDANVRSVVLTVVLSAQQAADSQRKALLEGPVARAAVEETILCMHTFHTCQQAFQAIAHAHVGDKKAVTIQLCLSDHYRIMRVATGMSSCWEHALLHSRRMAAVRATILSTQELVQTHAACTRVVINKATAVVAINASDSLHRYSSEVPALPELPPLVSHAAQADQMASAVNDIQDSLQTDPVQVERAKRTSTRVKTRHRGKLLSQTMAGPNGEQLASAQRTNKARNSTQFLSPQKRLSASGGMQRVPSHRTSTSTHKDTPHGRVTRAAADYSRSAQLLTSQHMIAHAAYKQEEQELNATNDELLARMQALPQRLESHARYQFVPRTIAKDTQDSSSLQEASALLDDEKRLATSRGQDSQ
jgi:hypothetical protein